MNRAGYTYRELARIHNITVGKVAGKIDRYIKSDQKKLKLFEVDLGSPWLLQGDWMIIGDVHLPCTDYGFLQLVIKVAKKYGIKKLIIAGDFFTLDIASKYQQVVPAIQWEMERKAGRLVVAELLEWFDDLRFLMGNHDRRLQRLTDGQLDENDIFGMISSSDKVHVSNWGHCVVENKNKDGYPWRITHSSNYSINQLTVADALSNKFQMNIISHHEHHLAQGWDRYKRFVVINNGCLVDQNKLAYVMLDDNKMSGMTLGFVMLQNGVATTFGKYPYTDWNEIIDEKE